MKVTFHLLGLAHQPVTNLVPACAYTAKVRNMALMLTAAGNKVYLYGAGSRCDISTKVEKYVQCVPDEIMETAFGKKFYLTYNHATEKDLVWKVFEAIGKKNILDHLMPGKNIILLSYGRYQEGCCPTELPEVLAVEMGIGYEGVFARWKVWESYSWMHRMYAWPIHAETRDQDVVIPNYLNPDNFFSPGCIEKGEDFLLYLGRVIPEKGVDWAYYAAETSGRKLVIAGPGDPEWVRATMPKAEYRGLVNSTERKQLLATASALLCPTKYIEPFGGVAVEAAYCGLPVIATDWGGFTETVLAGQTGFRVRTAEQAAEAIRHLGEIDPQVCYEWGKRFTMEVIWPLYSQYFQHLLEQTNVPKTKG